MAATGPVANPRRTRLALVQPTAPATAATEPTGSAASGPSSTDGANAAADTTVSPAGEQA